MKPFKMDAGEIKNILDEAQKARMDATNGVDTTKPNLDAGAYLMAMKDARIKIAKFGTNESIQVICLCNLADERNDKFRDIAYVFTVQSENERFEKIGKSMLIEFLDKAFKYVLKPCNDENDLLNQILTLKDVPFQAVIRTRDYLTKTKDPENPWKIATSTEIWYTGHEKDNDFSVDPTKLHKELSDEDKAKFTAGVTAGKGSGTDAFGGGEAENKPTATKSNRKKNEPQSQPVAEEEQSSGGPVDDLPF